MADPSEMNETSSDATQHTEGPPAAQALRIGNVFKVALPIVLLGVAGVVFVGFFDGLNWLASLVEPPLVRATGQVMYQGKPVEGAILSTRHTGGKLPGSIGWTDAQGRFSLQTDVDGYVDGIYAGDHQVIVTLPDMANAPTLGAPANIAPEKYTSYATTPLQITVSRVAEENEYVLKLEGDPPARPNAGPGGGGGFDPETIVGRVFENYDKDDDGKLTADEMQAIEEERVERIRQADANEDGVVERDELLQAFAPSPPQLE